ncbi:MAG: GTP-binding protein [Halobacteriota archaeon]|nr:GTP-binding protein [Halobacteriota archaeon]
MSPSIEEKIKEIEDEILKTQKNKATMHHLGKLKAKLAKLREESEISRSSGSKGKGFSIKKSGDATVGIIGFPSIGKSTLLNQLTAASSKIGAYDFTTLDAIPGMMKYKGADIQLLDLPGLITGASKGKGRGREILSAVRNVDLVILMVDGQRPDDLEVIERELYDAGLRLNRKKPDVLVTKKGQGGLIINTTGKLTHLNEDLIKTIASEFILNAEIIVRGDITEDQLIDSFSQNKIYVPAVAIINKSDLIERAQLKKTVKDIKGRDLDVIAISAKNGEGLDETRESIFTHLKLKRIYMKPVGKETDYEEPLILKDGDKVEVACKKLHRNFEKKFRYAMVWGPSAKHAGQKVGLDHELCDEDVLTIVTWK